MSLTIFFLHLNIYDDCHNLAKNRLTAGTKFVIYLLFSGLRSHAGTINVTSPLRKRSKSRPCEIYETHELEATKQNLNFETQKCL